MKNYHWDNVLMKLILNGEVDKLTTSSIDVLNRLSDIADEQTGLCYVELDKLARETNRNIFSIQHDINFLADNLVIVRHGRVSHPVIELHSRFQGSSKDSLENKPQ